MLEGGLIAAVDAMVEGVHFVLGWSTPADVGWKALAVNLSDLAAMAALPTAALVALVVPPDRDGLADGVADGLAEAAVEFGCPVVGGDTTAGRVLAVSVTVLGRVPDGPPVLRSGARPGDSLFVTGCLGGALHALDALRAGEKPDEDLRARLVRPRPRRDEGRAAAASAPTAMIDVSDGLARDLGHVCEQSGVGVRLDGPAVPLAAGASLREALVGGDEYELLFAAPDADAVTAAFRAAGLAPPALIGRMTEGPDRVLVGLDGSESALPDVGWEHPVP